MSDIYSMSQILIVYPTVWSKKDERGPWSFPCWRLLGDQTIKFCAALTLYISPAAAASLQKRKKLPQIFQTFHFDISNCAFLKTDLPWIIKGHRLPWNRGLGTHKKSENQKKYSYKISEKQHTLPLASTSTCLHYLWPSASHLLSNLSLSLHWEIMGKWPTGSRPVHSHPPLTHQGRNYQIFFPATSHFGNCWQETAMLTSHYFIPAMWLNISPTIFIWLFAMKYRKVTYQPEGGKTGNVNMSSEAKLSLSLCPLGGSLPVRPLSRDTQILSSFPNWKEQSKTK